METRLPGDWTDPTIVQSLLIPWGIRIAVALAIFIVGRGIARWLAGIVRKVMTRSHMHEVA